MNEVLRPQQALSGLETQALLRKFVQSWRDFNGTERAEAQTFLNELFEAFGTSRKAVAKFEDFKSSAGFMDLHWPTVCIFEMKAPSRAHSLHMARDQVMRYWQESSQPDIDQPAARWVVICAFQRFEIWEPGRYPSAPRLAFDIEELPDRYEALQFLAGPAREPTFLDHYKDLTKEAAAVVASVYQRLKDRSAAPLDEIQRFTLQSVWALFAEDLGMLDGHPMQTIVASLRHNNDRSSAAELGHFFRVLNQKGSHNRKGVLSGTRYVNGDLFKDPAAVDLDASELDLLYRAAEFDWRKVNPTIFGSLLEGIVGPERRRELGTHYTHESDIMKIVAPTIIRPWRELIEKIDSVALGISTLEALCKFRVLDPACGCGNFLYVAYRELRALEAQIKDRIEECAADSGLERPDRTRLPFYPLSNLYGIDIEQMAVLVARVTLWMGHRQMISLYGPAENPLPLVDLSGIRVADALRTDWPEVDCIVGNPPFLGASHIRGTHGDEYADWLKRAYGVGIKDYCVYWFRKAHDELTEGQRAGLVGTNSVSQNLGRSASLEYIGANDGHIVDAVASQRWPGEARVHVSIVNWVRSKQPRAEPRFLDGRPVKAIGSDLRTLEGAEFKAFVLQANSGFCFEGPSPKAKGFILTDDEAKALLDMKGVDYSDVVRPYMTADDIADSPTQAASRWTIDFGLRPLEEARKYPAAYRIALDRVKPERAGNNRKSYRERFWLFAEPRTAMRSALAPLTRYIATAGHAKRLILCWCDPWTLSSNAINVFAFEDDYSMGVLQSRAHVAWAWSRSSTLETRLRYTPTSVFATFPWPQNASTARREEVSDASRRLLARRDEICARDGLGLTQVYNLVDEGAYAELASLQKKLDIAVTRCYGWPRSVAQDDEALVRLLRERNEKVKFGAPYGGPHA
jgi:hypothetical protein